MDILVIIFMALGFLFFLGGAVGIIRMPDFYSRLHPAGKLDTLGIMAMVAGLALYNLHHFSFEALLLSVKMLLIVFFVFMSSPTATHSIVDAGMRAGLRPWSRKTEFPGSEPSASEPSGPKSNGPKSNGPKPSGSDKKGKE